MKQTYKIPEENLELLQKKVKQISNKATKLIGSLITLTITGEEFIQDEKTKEYNKLIIIDIEGEAPHYNGWEFVATLQHNFENGNIIKSAGQNVPEEYRTVPIKCDHCGINRFRKDTYVVKNENNEYKQVGSGCLKDFFNGRDPHQIAKYAELLFNMDTYVGGYTTPSQPTKYIDIKDFLNITNQLIQKFGYISSKKAEQIAEENGFRPMTTAQEAYDNIYGVYYKGKEIIYPNKENEEIATEALQWIKNQSANNNYMHNLITICSSDFIDHRSIGIAASLIPAYYRATHEIKEKKITSEYIGNPNEKIEIKAILQKMFSYDTKFGTTYIYKFTDENGNILVWKTSPKDFEEEKEYKIKGTIKEHEEYRGEKQTQLTRCKVESI